MEEPKVQPEPVVPSPSPKRFQKKHVFALLGALAILVVGLIVVLNQTEKTQDTRSRAASSDQNPLGSAVSETSSRSIRIISPKDDVVSPSEMVTVFIDSTFTPNVVEFWEDNESKEPLFSDHEAPFEMDLATIRPGKHDIYAIATDTEGNGIISETVTFRLSPKVTTLPTGSSERSKE